MEAAQVDPTRFEALYRKYVAQVYSYAVYELRDRHDAEDATERTFLAALAHLGRFEERARPEDGEGASTFRVWLFRIARNVVANERRQARRRRRDARSRRRRASPTPLDLEPDVTSRDETRAALRCRSAACPATGVVRWSCGSSTRCPPRRSPASSVAPRAPSACSSIGRSATSRATSASDDR